MLCDPLKQPLELTQPQECCSGQWRDFPGVEWSSTSLKRQRIMLSIHSAENTFHEFGVRPKRIRLYRPQVNGKIERLHCTMAYIWAYSKPDMCENERRTALPA